MILIRLRAGAQFRRGSCSCTCMSTRTTARAVPTVAVLLCTWRAGDSLDRQLDSIAVQDWPVTLFVQDDASGDDTALRARAHPAVTHVRVNSNNLGFVENFGTAIDLALAHSFDYIALADQDDVWHSDRVSSGMHQLLQAEADLGTEHPILAHSDLQVIDGNDTLLKSSFLRYRGYSTGDRRHLPTMLGQCGVLGNTVLMNRSMAELSRPFPAGLHSHDWWLGLVAELFGTRCFIDKATVDYRLHDSNTSNTLDSLAGRRLTSLRRGIAGGLVKRDLRLPFHEDSRSSSLKTLLTENSRWPSISPSDRNVIETFISYLDLKEPRGKLLLLIFRGGYLKPTLLHRARVAFALLFTQRYESRVDELGSSDTREGSSHDIKESV